jgi:hypothetical protein
MKNTLTALRSNELLGGVAIAAASNPKFNHPFQFKMPSRVSKALTFITGCNNVRHFSLNITIQVKKDSISTTKSNKSRCGGHRTDFTEWSNIIQLSHPTLELTGRPTIKHNLSTGDKVDESQATGGRVQ